MGSQATILTVMSMLDMGRVATSRRFPRRAHGRHTRFEMDRDRQVVDVQSMPSSSDQLGDNNVIRHFNKRGASLRGFGRRAAAA